MSLKQLFCLHREEEATLCKDNNTGHGPTGMFWLWCCKRCGRLRVTRF